MGCTTSTQTQPSGQNKPAEKPADNKAEETPAEPAAEGEIAPR